MPDCRASQTGFPCWKCGSELLDLTQNLMGFRYYCSACEHLTDRADSTIEAINDGRRKGADSCVVAINVKLTLRSCR